MTPGLPPHQDPRWLEERLRPGVTYAQVADECGVSVHAIRKWAARHGLAGRGRAATAPYADRLWLAARVREGLTDRQIAVGCGASPATIFEWRKRFGLAPATRRSARSATGTATGLHRDEAWLRERAAAGLSYRRMADEAGVTQDTLRKWASRYGVGSTFREPASGKHTDRDWLAARVDEGMSQREIGEAAGVSSGIVHRWLARFGLHSAGRPGRPPSQQAVNRDTAVAPVPAATPRHRDRAWLSAQARAGRTIPAVARSLGVNDTTVRTWAGRLGIDFPDGRRRPRSYHEHDWLQRGLSADATLEELAAEAGVAPRTIRNWLTHHGLRVEPLRDRHLDRTWLRDRVDRGWAATEIAAEAGTSPAAIYQRLRAEGIDPAGQFVKQDVYVRERLANRSGINASAWLLLPWAYKSVLGAARRWLARLNLGLDEATALDLAAFAVTELEAGATVNATIVTALNLYDDHCGRARRSHLVKAVLTVQNRARSEHEPRGFVVPLVVLDQVLNFDPLVDLLSDPSLRNRLRALAVMALQDAGVPLTDALALRRSDITFDADHATVRLGAANVTVRASGTGRAYSCPLLALRLAASIPSTRGPRADRLVADPRRVRELLTAPATVVDDVREAHVAPLLTVLWGRFAFQHALRAGAPGGVELRYLRGPDATFRIPTKGSLTNVRLWHTPGHRLCHRCAADDLLSVLPDDLASDTRLVDLRSSQVVAGRLLTMAAARGYPRGSVVMSGMRRTMATLHWSHTRSVTRLRLLLGHARESEATPRYVQSLEVDERLADDGYDVAGWLRHVTGKIAKRRTRFRQGVAKPRSDSMTRTEAVAAAESFLRAVSPSLLSPLTTTYPARAARLDYQSFVERARNAGGERPDPWSPATLRLFATFELTTVGTRPERVREKLRYVAERVTLPADREAFLAPARHLVQRHQAHMRKTGALPAVEQASFILRDELVEWVTLARTIPELHEWVTLVRLAWNGALRPGASAAVAVDDLVFTADAVTIDVRSGTKRRVGTTRPYRVTVPATGDILCPLLLGEAHGVTPPGQSLVGLPLTRGLHDRKMALGATARAGRLWARARATLAQAGADRLIAEHVTGMSLRHSRAVEHFTSFRDLLRTQTLLGHASPEATLVYLTRLDPFIRSHAAGLVADELTDLVSREGSELLRRDTASLVRGSSTRNTAPR